jgi:hypothetical protein
MNQNHNLGNSLGNLVDVAACARERAQSLKTTSERRRVHLPTIAQPTFHVLMSLSWPPLY